MPTKEKIRQAVDAMILTERMHRHLLDSHVAKEGLSRTHHMILMMLSCKGKITSQKQLAAKLGITPAAVTGALAKLEKEGYLLRTAGEDSRKNEIDITERGRRLVDQTRNTFQAIDSSLFEGFSDEEIDRYVACLEKLRGNMMAKKEGEE